MGVFAIVPFKLWTATQLDEQALTGWRLSSRTLIGGLCYRLLTGKQTPLQGENICPEGALAEWHSRAPRLCKDVKENQRQYNQ